MLTLSDSLTSYFDIIVFVSDFTLSQTESCYYILGLVRHNQNLKVLSVLILIIGLILQILMLQTELAPKTHQSETVKILSESLIIFRQDIAQ